MMTRQRIFGHDTPFSAWLRAQPELDSIAKGITAHDIDMMIHKYKDNVDNMGARIVQLMMNVEVKTRGGLPSKAQLQTLSFCHQRLNGKGPLFCPLDGNMKSVWHFGCFVLSMPGEKPGDKDEQGGDLMAWYIFDNLGRLRLKDWIDTEKLISILKFETRPDTLKFLSLRRHHKTIVIEEIETTKLGFKVPRIVTKKS